MQRILQPGWSGHFISLLMGGLITLSLAPFNFWPLALVAVAWLYLAVNELSPKQSFVRGWWFGFGAFLSGTSWVYVSIHNFGNAPPWLAGLLTLGFVGGLGLLHAVQAWAWSRWFKPAPSSFSAPFAFAALWVAFEAFRGWFLTGFPWLYLGYSQVEGPFSGLVPVGGVWLASFALALCGALLGYALLQHHRASAIWQSLVSLGALLLGALALHNNLWTQPKSNKPLSVIAIQANVEQNLKWDPAALNQQLQLYRQMTLAAGGADLVIWPETAVPYMKDLAFDYLALMDDWARANHSSFITGIPIRQHNEHGELRYYNGITTGGQAQGDYLKQKLVPFGEYVPLQETLRGLIEFFDLPMSDFAKGPTQQSPIQAGEYQIAPYICYEVVYPEFAAELAAQSDVLLTISNDTWFGRSLGPLQHLQMAQMRALEAGRWMVRATNNGVSVIIDPKGKITERIPQFEQAVLSGEVLPMQGLTPYLQWRSWPLIMLSSLFLFLGFWKRRSLFEDQ
ncbi:acyltransferase [Thiopseudomonas alkaliphila]|uniref:apolipoprotein N-acyltransferase n=1 Tax=Thiopseudomonas alkaliphila TaxID=1697053 RepID=UPI00069ED1C5|nr:apolipoprotein N-acyltransferase [Thiopseudomonas alkaliphila]AKX47750.1 acyltransferase [Thiopseudomonas alkaliphila]AKX48038.1 acyltransferase [Thiopseudomonas alkaliphila]AKX53174.1 acyltransferase [Thiopseudomonas alkaliphila]